MLWWLTGSPHLPRRRADRTGALRRPHPRHPRPADSPVRRRRASPRLTGATTLTRRRPMRPTEQLVSSATRDFHVVRSHHQHVTHPCPQHRSAGGTHVQLRWITATGVSEHPLDAAAELLARSDGLVWLDIPTWDDTAEDLLRDVFAFHPMAITALAKRLREFTARTSPESGTVPGRVVPRGVRPHVQDQGIRPGPGTEADRRRRRPVRPPARWPTARRRTCRERSSSTRRARTRRSPSRRNASP